jgi:hypothetical protein
LLDCGLQKVTEFLDDPVYELRKDGRDFRGRRFAPSCPPDTDLEHQPYKISPGGTFLLSAYTPKERQPPSSSGLSLDATASTLFS